MTREPHTIPRRRPALLAASLLVLALLSPLAAVATTARILALGGNGAFFEDEANVLRWYGSLGDYPDLAVLDSGRFNLGWGYHNRDMELLSGPAGGIHRSFGEEGRWGTAAVYFHRRDSEADPGSLAGSRLTNTVTALYSRTVGPVSAAFVFRRGSLSESSSVEFDSLVDVPSNFDRDQSRTDIGAGLRWDLSESAYTDLAGEFKLSRIEETRTTTAGDVDSDVRRSSGTFNLRSRTFIQTGPRTTLVPVAEFMLADVPYPAPMFGPVPELNGYRVRIGCGLNYFPDTDKLLMTNLEYRRGSTEYIRKDEYGYALAWTRDWDSFLAGLGVETRFLSWVTLRASVNYEYIRISQSGLEPYTLLHEEFAEHDDFVELTTNLGAGVHLGKFDVDLALTENYPGTPAGYVGVHLIPDADNWLTATLRAEF